MSLPPLVLAHIGHLLIDIPIFLGPVAILVGVLVVLNLRGGDEEDDLPDGEGAGGATT